MSSAGIETSGKQWRKHYRLRPVGNKNLPEESSEGPCVQKGSCTASGAVSCSSTESESLSSNSFSTGVTGADTISTAMSSRAGVRSSRRTPSSTRSSSKSSCRSTGSKLLRTSTQIISDTENNDAMNISNAPQIRRTASEVTDRSSFSKSHSNSSRVIRRSTSEVVEELRRTESTLSARSNKGRKSIGPLTAEQVMEELRRTDSNVSSSSARGGARSGSRSGSRNRVRNSTGYASSSLQRTISVDNSYASSSNDARVRRRPGLTTDAASVSENSAAVTGLNKSRRSVVALERDLDERRDKTRYDQLLKKHQQIISAVETDDSSIKTDSSALNRITQTKVHTNDTVDQGTTPATPRASQHRRRGSAPSNLSPTTTDKRDLLRQQILKSRRLQLDMRKVQAEQREEILTLRQKKTLDPAVDDLLRTCKSDTSIPAASTNSTSTHDEDKHSKIRQRVRQQLAQSNRRRNHTPTVETVGESVVVHNHDGARRGESSQSPNGTNLSANSTLVSSFSSNDLGGPSCDTDEDEGRTPGGRAQARRGSNLQSLRRNSNSSRKKGMQKPPLSSPSSAVTNRAAQAGKGQGGDPNAPNFPSPSTSMARLSRQVRLNHRGEATVKSQRTTNNVRIHVYDLIHSETWVETPWGCEFPLGKCFAAVNSSLHYMGTGAYHAAVEINGVEYAYGSSDLEGVSGVFTCPPKESPGYEYRTTLDFGDVKTINRRWIRVPVPITNEESTFQQALTPHTNTARGGGAFFGEDDEDSSTNGELRAASDVVLSLGSERLTTPRKNPSTPYSRNAGSSTEGGEIAYTSVYRDVESFVDGSIIMKQMAKEYLGVEYDLFRRNCCTFVKDACIRMGVQEKDIPTWFLNLAETGVSTEDALATMDGNVCVPIKDFFEATGEVEKKSDTFADMDELSTEGFEVIATPRSGNYEIVSVEEHNGLPMFDSSGRPVPQSSSRDSDLVVGMRETMSWTY